MQDEQFEMLDVPYFAIINYCRISFCDLSSLWKKNRNLFLRSQFFNNILKFLKSEKQRYDLYGNNVYVFFIKKSTL